MIDEKELIKEIADFKRCQKSTNCDYLTGYISALSAVEGMIAEQPKLGEWIPVSERLPDKKGLYLVSHGENYSVRIEEFNGIRHFSTIHNYSQPKAWLPLQEPYKGE